MAFRPARERSTSVQIQSNPEAKKNQDLRISGSGGDSPLRPELPAPKGSGRFPRSSKKKPPPPLSLDAILSRLHRLGRKKEAAALEYCGRSATLFECPDHDVWVPRFCGKPYCPKCGEEGSPIHLRRYSRIVKRIEGVRWQKDVVTLPEKYRPTSKLEVKDLAQIVADMIMVWYDVPAALIAVHWLGEVSQGIHFEVFTPDHGRRRTKAELLGIREWLAWGLDFDVSPVVNHQYVSSREALGTQQAKWWHGTRYSAHPTGYSGRWDGMSDEDLQKLLSMMGGFHTIRGYGLWSTSKCRSQEARDLAQQYPIDLGEDQEETSGVIALGKVHDDGECPICQQALSVFRARTSDGRTVIPGVTIPAEAEEVIEGVYATPSDARKRRRRRGAHDPPAAA